MNAQLIHGSSFITHYSSFVTHGSRFPISLTIMNISELSLRRPVLAIVISLVILLFGFIGFTFLGVRDYPAIDPPNVSVSTSYSGANADVIENQITEPLEKAINSV